MAIASAEAQPSASRREPAKKKKKKEKSKTDWLGFSRISIVFIKCIAFSRWARCVDKKNKRERRVKEIKQNQLGAS